MGLIFQSFPILVVHPTFPSTKMTVKFMLECFCGSGFLDPHDQVALVNGAFPLEGLDPIISTDNVTLCKQSSLGWSC